MDGGLRIAQPHRRDGFAVGELALDVGELAAVADAQLGESGPAGGRVGAAVDGWDKEDGQLRAAY